MSTGGVGGAAAAVPLARAMPARIAIQSLLFILASCRFAEGGLDQTPFRRSRQGSCRGHEKTLA
jgi:hypothetical protein